MKINRLITLPLAALTALLFAPATAPAQSILLSAGNFAILGGTFISSTGVVGTDIVSGNVGLYPAATTFITGFPPAVVTGGGAIIGTGGETQQAQLDLTKAYNGLLAMPSNVTLSNTDLGGLTLDSGVYTFGGAASQSGALVLDAQGKNHAYWVFQIGTSLTTSINSSVTIINPGSNGGSDDAVFWVAGAAITVGANNAILGNYLAGTSITFGGTTSGNGRALAMAGVTLAANPVNSQGGPSGSDYTGGLMYNASGAVVPTPPIFTTQPTNQSVTTGSNATFNVAASNSPTIQWQRQAFGTLTYVNLTNSGAYSNVTTTTLTITNTTLVMSGDQFRAVATNGGGNATSTSALLTVTTPLPIFSVQPISENVTTGANTTFTVLASGGATYQWQREPFGTLVFSNITDGGAYTGSNTTTLSVDNTTLVMSGDQFQAVATNAGGNTTSTTALLTVQGSVTPLPIFTTQPISENVTTGSNATFTAVASGAVSYQWQREAFGNLTYANLTNTGAYSNVTGTVLSVTNTTLVMSGDQFRAVATNVGGSTTSTSALLTVTTPLPIFSAQPTNQSGFVGFNATFSALANGNATYQWQREPAGNLIYANLTNTGAYSNVTGTTLSVTNTTYLMNGDQFRVVATNLGGSTSSTSALLTVIVPVPTITTQPGNQTAVAGMNTTFSVVASGNSTYQWQELAIGSGNYVDLTDTGVFTGTTTGTLSITGATIGMSGDLFRAVATNVGGNVTSDAATLTVISALPVIVQQPVGLIIKVTANAMFTVVATGPGVLTYQWEKNGVKLKNGPRQKQVTTATLLLIHQVFGDAGSYSVVVSNANGSVTSVDARLVVSATALPFIHGSVF